MLLRADPDLSVTILPHSNHGQQARVHQEKVDQGLARLGYAQSSKPAFHAAQLDYAGA